MRAHQLIVGGLTPPTAEEESTLQLSVFNLLFGLGRLQPHLEHPRRRQPDDAHSARAAPPTASPEQAAAGGSPPAPSRSPVAVRASAPSAPSFAHRHVERRRTPRSEQRSGPQPPGRPPTTNG